MSIFTATHEFRNSAGNFEPMTYSALSYDAAQTLIDKATKNSVKVNVSIKCAQAGPDLIGTGATICCYSDRHACTIIAVSKSGKKVTVQSDTATRTDKNGMSDSQSYEYAANPKGAIKSFTLRKNGRWIQAGDPAKGGTPLAIGWRGSYYDYSF